MIASYTEFAVVVNLSMQIVLVVAASIVAGVLWCKPDF